MSADPRRARAPFPAGVEGRGCGRFAQAPVFLALATLALLLGAPSARAQQGDQPGEPQPPPPVDAAIPPAPVLSPADAQRAFQVADGFVIELVAAEPLVVDPVMIAFGADGGLWVVEMRGFMPNVDGAGEQAPVGRVAVLRDTDGDGLMDRREEFLDGLVLPRSVAPVHDGALVIAPPDLLFCRDTNGDGRADERRVVHTGFGGLDNPEHAGNGLLYGLDNWLYLSQHPQRLRFDGNRIVAQPTGGHGQWGIARDDEGRLYYSPNSDPLRVDLLSPHYAGRNPGQPRMAGIYEQAARDHRVWPIRVTYGVNRGYRAETLNADGRLATFTAACGPVIYRGTSFPAPFRGDAFVCEPSGNLVKHFDVHRDDDGRVTARPQPEGGEFLASTDERFRPVNLAVGGDGALYVVDFYRGIIQHRIFMTTYLRRQVLERGLDAPVGLGRIWRVRPAGATVAPAEDLAARSSADLVDLLHSADGWHRDTAQRLLVERGATEVAGHLREIARGGAAVPAQHALWTLEGLGVLSRADALAACGHEHPAVRIAGVRLCEGWLNEARVLDVLARRGRDDALPLRVQVAASLGASRSATARYVLTGLLARHPDAPRVRAAALSGLRDRELDVLEAMLETWRGDGPGRRALVEEFAAAALQQHDPRATTSLVELLGHPDDGPWHAPALLASLARAARVGTTSPRRLALAWEPVTWSSWRAAGDETVRALDEHLAWPGRVGTAVSTPLTADEQARWRSGRRLYALHCASCHQAAGLGQAALAPPLAGSPRVLGPERRLVRVLLHGLTGPLETEAGAFDSVMPALDLRDDESMAAILTYVRRAWGNDAAPVAADLVREERAATAGREAPWTIAELE